MRKPVRDALLLIALGCLASVPFAILLATHDGLPGNAARIAEYAMTVGVGFSLIGLVVMMFMIGSPKRLHWAAVVVLSGAATAFVVAFVRTFPSGTTP